MSKFSWFILILSVLIVLNLTAQSLSLSTTVDVIARPDADATTISGIIDFFKTFGKMLTFSLDGVPFLLNLVLYPLLALELLIIIDTIR